MADFDPTATPLEDIGSIHDTLAGTDSSWADGATNLGKWVTGSLAAAGTGLYNTGVAAVNVLGGNAQKISTYSVLSDFDSDLAKYYNEHQPGIEVTGMVVGAIVPGMGGVKLARAGQSAMRAASLGEGGTLTARLTGILAPDVGAFSAMAKADVAASSARFPLLQSSVLKAIGTQFQQQALESAAFTLASTPTMLQSPIMSDADTLSVAKDMAWGTLIGGVFGGIIGGIGVMYGSSKAATAFDIAKNQMFPRTSRTGILPGSKVVGYVDDLRAVAPPVQAEDVLLGKVPGLLKEFPPVDDVKLATGLQREVADKLAAKMNTARSQFLDDVANNIKASITEAGADTDLTRRLSSLIRMTDGDTGFMLNVEKVSRAFDGELSKVGQKQGKTVSFLQLFDDAGAGGKAGDMYTSAPQLWRMADTVDDSAQLAARVSKNKVAIARTVDFSDFAKYNELDADARYIRVSQMDKFDTAVEYNKYDIPVIKRAIETNSPLNIEGTVMPVTMLQKHLAMSVDDLLQKAASMEKGAPTADAMAHRLDITRSYIDGVKAANWQDDLFASAAADMRYHEQLTKHGLVTPGAGFLRTRELPKFAALHNAVVPKEATVLVNNFTVDAAASVKARLQLAQQQAERYTVMAFPEMQSDFARLAKIDPMQASRSGAGAKAFGYSNSSYLSAASAAEHNGLVTNTIKNKAAEAAMKDGMPVFRQLVNDTEASAEMGAIMAQVQRAGEQYVPRTLLDKSNVLIRRAVFDELSKRADKTGTVLDELLTDAKMLDNLGAHIPAKYTNVPNVVTVKNSKVFAAVTKHTEMSDRELWQAQHLDMARGVDSSSKTERLLGGFYVPQANPSLFPFKAFVQDLRLGNGTAGRTTMIHAADEQQLRAMIDKIPQDGTYRVYTRAEAERFYAAEGAKEYAETLHDARINSDLASMGIMSPAYVVTDGSKLAEMLNDFHVGRARMQATDAVSARFQSEFDTLREMGQRHRDISGARMGKIGENSLVRASDPYTDIIKTTLDQSRFSEYAGLYGVDQFLNKTADSLVRNVRMLMTRAKSPEDLDKISKIMADHGVQTPWQDAAGQLLANHPAGTQSLTKFVRRVNGLMASLTLSDTLNAANNAVGAAFMRSNELRFVLNGIRAGKADVVGELSKLATLKGGGIEMLSPAKMQARAYAEFVQQGTKHPLYVAGKQAGWIKDSTDVMHAVIDELTPGMSDTAAKLNSRVEKAMSMLRKVTLNDLAENTNRFVSAHVAKQITDLGIKAGVISPKEADTIITTFINRVEGTLLASQKPIIFNGAIGSAMGLFQSYTFRLAQQLLRNVAEGGGKEAAMLAGLQSTFYGMRGLPAWDAMNQHILGTMSTNPQHRDAYDALYSGAGKEGGDLLLYGLPSNILQTNLYTRGDINPRHPTIIPVNPLDLPIVGMMQKALGMANTIRKEGAETGNIGHALLSGLEQNGINRPLAGLAQLTKGLVYQNGTVVANSKQGNPLFASSLYDWTQLSRLAGGRPLEESAAIDGVYRVQAYKSAANTKRAELAQQIRNELAAGTLTPEAMESHVASFVRTGERQDQFAKWAASVVKAASKTEAEQLTAGLNTPFSYKMQLVMGGKPSW